MDPCTAVSPSFDLLRLAECADGQSSLTASTHSALSDCDFEEQPLKARRFSGSFKAPSRTATTEPPCQPAWLPSDSSALYNVEGWGAGYFSCGENGHLLVKPQGGEFEAAPSSAATRHFWC
jgi:hypothetical protein